MMQHLLIEKILQKEPLQIKYDIAKDPKYDGYQRGLTSMVYKFFDSKVASPDKKIRRKWCKAH